MSLKLNKMDWIVVYCLFVLNVLIYNGGYATKFQNLLDLVKRRSMSSEEDISPNYPDHLPEAEKTLPGHTLLKPTLDMLKSAMKYPHNDLSQKVYGNVNNIGITYGNTNERVRYTGFRKNTQLAATIKALVQNFKSKKNINSPLILIELDPSRLQSEASAHDINAIIPEYENNASEIIDDVDSIEYNPRRARKVKSEFRHRHDSESTESSEMSTSSASSDYEKNPGNPYTIHKDKYLQNWLWNHNMDGDHMNVNPYAPIFTNFGPSGTALFFGRKWWYFNQDDYKPLE